MRRRLMQGLLLVGVAAVRIARGDTQVTLVDAVTKLPLPGVAISRVAATTRPADPSPVGVSDRDGRIAVKVDPLERTVFLATAPHRAPTLFGFWGAAPRSHMVPIGSSVRWRGHVVNPDGSPAVGVRVKLIYPYLDAVQGWNHRLPPLSLQRSALTDRAGGFEFDLNPEDYLPSRLQVDRGPDCFADVPASDDDEDNTSALRNGTLRVQLADAPVAANRDGLSKPRIPATRPATPPLAVRLHVVDDATGQPIRDVRVTPAGAISPDQWMRLRERGTMRFVDEPIEWTFADGAWAYLLRAEADGYAAKPTRVVKASEKSVDLELRLRRATRATLVLTGPTGKPAGGAKLYLATPELPLDVRSVSQRYRAPFAIADGNGVASFDLPDEPCRLAAVADEGCAEIDLTKGSNDRRAERLQAWASVTVHLGNGKPFAPAVLDAQSSYSEDAGCMIDWDARVPVGATGSVTLARWRPGGFLGTVMRNGVSSTHPIGWSNFDLRVLPLTPGEHREVVAMNGAASVRATLIESPGQRWSAAFLECQGRPCTLPAGLSRLPEADQRKAVRAAMKATATTRPGPDSAAGYVALQPTADGQIGCDGLPPGTYLLVASAYGPDGTFARSLQRYVVIPTNGSAVDLGVLSPDAGDKPVFDVGDRAPELKSDTLDGRPFDLATLRGKWVLLDFWGTWCGFCVAEQPTYLDAYEGWAADGRLTMVSLDVGDTAEQVRKHLATHRLPWTHVLLGNRDHTDVPRRFAVDGYPTVQLISPEGKLVASGLRGASLHEALLKYLGPPSPPKK